MKTLITFAASLAINLVALGSMEWSAHEAQRPPRGEVFVTQLPAGDLELYARAVEQNATGTL